MKREIFKKLFNIKEITIKEKIALSTTLLVLLIIVANILYSFDNNNYVINYDEFNISDLISTSSEIADRQTFWNLTGIVSKFLKSYNLEIKSNLTEEDYKDIDYRREDYYYVLSDGYKRKLNKKAYLEQSKNMCQKFVITDASGKRIKIYADIIKNVYLLPKDKYGENMYLCELNTSAGNYTSYIGIQLFMDSNKYNIFYLE